MSEFVKDQWVECVDAGGNTCIKNGGFYRIEKVSPFCGTVDLEGVSNPCFKSRFRPVSWQVGKTYKTTLEGVTATIDKVDSMFVYGPRSDTPGDKWMWHVETGLFDGYEDSTSEPHLTPYLVDTDPSPAVETSEPSKSQQIRDDVHQFDTGAVRGTDANGTRFDLISPHILQALAETYAEGAQKYGDDNWLKGIPSKDLMNHALRHINLWQLGDTSEDHLAHAMWNLGAIIHFTKTRPELIVRQYAPQPE